MLATPVVLWAGWPIFERGWASIVNRSLNMFTLIGAASGAAYFYSLAATIAPGIFPASFRVRMAAQSALYFEPAAVIVTLVLLGQVLELRARSQTSSAIRALLGLAPKTARRIRARGVEEDIALEQRASRRPAARAAGRERSGGRRGARGREFRGRIDDHRRTDSGRKNAGRPGDRRHGERHGRIRDAGGAGGRRYDAGAESSRW